MNNARDVHEHEYGMSGKFHPPRSKKIEDEVHFIHDLLLLGDRTISLCMEKRSKMGNKRLVYDGKTSRQNRSMYGIT